MFVSTREMLGQVTADRASAEAIIKRKYGRSSDWSQTLAEPGVSAALRHLGLSAFSDSALQQIASMCGSSKALHGNEGSRVSEAEASRT